MGDFLDEKREEIRGRLAELAPLVDEYHRLTAAAAALDGVPANEGRPSASAASPPTRRARGRTAPKRAASNGGGRRGRPKGSSRAATALALVRSKPGITIPEMAEQMGMKQNYLYRVLPGLAQDGLVKKDGRGWHPQEPAAGAAATTA